MKKLLFLFLSVSFVILYSTASAEKPTIVLKNKALAANDSANKILKTDPKQAIKILTDFITFYDAQPQAVKDSTKYLKANRYFTICQYYKYLNNDKMVINTFSKALDAGFNDWNWLSMENELCGLVLKDTQLAARLDTVRLIIDFPYILKKSAPYNNKEKTDYKFTYASPNDTNLVALRKYFNLDSVAGNGDETSKIINLMSFVHNLVPHDGNNGNPTGANMIEDVMICKRNNTGANCRGLARMLNQCYLAMGFKSRYVTCYPKKYISDCHVINSVWSDTYKKWLWMDPTNEAYVMDDKGNLLSIEDVRTRLITDSPITINKDANWNHRFKVSKEYYIDYYMTKNLYYVSCNTYFGYNNEKKDIDNGKYLLLCPINYKPNLFNKTTDIVTTNAKHFWKVPK